MRLKDARINEMNTQIVVTGLVKNLCERKTRKGDTYLDVVLMDNDVVLSCKYFNVDSLNCSLGTGDVIEASITINEYNNQPSYIITGSKSTSYSPDSYIAWFEKLNALKAEFLKMLDEIKNETYKCFINELILRTSSDFSTAPAAKSIHHTEFGGCLSHSVLVALNCKNIATLYNSVYSKDKPFLDLDLVVTGALIHDMAKTVELDWNCLTGEVDYSNDSSCLDSHITLLSEWLTEIAVHKGLLNTEEYRLLKHCALSHHGKLEWGSPITPAIPEALIISTCDKLDADVWGFRNALNGIKDKQSEYCKVGGEFKRIYRK